MKDNKVSVAPILYRGCQGADFLLGDRKYKELKDLILKSNINLSFNNCDNCDLIHCNLVCLFTKDKFQIIETEIKENRNKIEKYCEYKKEKFS